MKNKQTAVEWLIEQLWAPCRGIPDFMIEKAKEIEKQQIINAFIGNDSDTDENLEVAEQYYNETYNQ